MTLLIVTSVALSIGLLSLCLLALYASHLKRNPDPIPRAVLAEDPRGTTAMLSRPDGGMIRTITAGTGPTVVLAHGYGITLKEWNIVMNRLVERGFRVVAFDQMGHGQSTIGDEGLDALQMASNYKRVLDALEVKDGVLVGHSMGGFLALKALLNFPEVAERLKGLVLFASTAGDVSRGAPQNKIQLPLLKTGLLTGFLKRDLFALPFGASIMGEAPSPAATRTFVADFLTQDHAQLLPALTALVETSQYDRLSEITLPTVVICGRKDKTTPPWHSETLGREIPGARNVWVEKRGHMLNWEAPESLIQVIDELHGKTEA